MAHKILEIGVPPASEALGAQGLEDLEPVFASPEYKELSKAAIERELAFIMCVPAAGYDCFVRGRMDAVASGDPPRVIDYKFATWREGAEAAYEIQMTAYCLALMKSTGAERSIGELWYLRKPMKVLRREYTLAESEACLSDLLARYVHALDTDTWTLAPRSHCDAIECGFRAQCWSPESAIRNPQSEIS